MKWLDTDMNSTYGSELLNMYKNGIKRQTISIDDMLDKFDFKDIEKYVRRKKINNINKKK